jgi:hypothetical protein
MTEETEVRRISRRIKVGVTHGKPIWIHFGITSVDDLVPYENDYTYIYAMEPDEAMRFGASLIRAAWKALRA